MVGGFKGVGRWSLVLDILRLESPSRYLSDIEDAVGYGRINLDGEVQARDRNLGFTSV